MVSLCCVINLLFVQPAFGQSADDFIVNCQVSKKCQSFIMLCNQFAILFQMSFVESNIPATV